MVRVLYSRGLNDCSDLPYMIGSFASGATISLVTKMNLKKILTLPLSIEISSYLEAEIDNWPFLLFYSMRFKDCAQEGGIVTFCNFAVVIILVKG